MATFDAPSREFCKQRRPESNTPLQALMTMNGKAFFEAARALAKRLKSEWPEATLDERLAKAYLLATGESPTPAERKALLAAQKGFQNDYENFPAKAQELGSTPEEAATIMVCSALLNTDEFLTR
jgi:hypothetical protein